MCFLDKNYLVKKTISITKRRHILKKKTYQTRFSCKLFKFFDIKYFVFGIGFHYFIIEKSDKDRSMLNKKMRSNVYCNK